MEDDEVAAGLRLRTRRPDDIAGQRPLNQCLRHADKGGFSQEARSFRVVFRPVEPGARGQQRLNELLQDLGIALCPIQANAEHLLRAVRP